MSDISFECSLRSYDATLTDTQFSSTGGHCATAANEVEMLCKEKLQSKLKSHSNKVATTTSFIIFFPKITLIIFATFLSFLVYLV